MRAQRCQEGCVCVGFECLMSNPYIHSLFRFAGRTDKRGHELYCWAEDGSWVLGRQVRVPKERSTCA